MSLLRHLRKHGAINSSVQDLHDSDSPIAGAPIYVDLTGVVREERELTRAAELRALPPFDDAWIEWRDQNAGEVSIGCRVYARRGAIDQRLTILDIGVFFAFNGHYRGTAVFVGGTSVALNPNGSEVTSRDALVSAATEELMGLSGSTRPRLPDPESDETTLVRYVAPYARDPETADTFKPFLRIAGHGVLEGYNLLNCENIGIEPVTGPEAKGRSRRAKGTKGLVWHRLVVVKPSVRQEYGLRVPRGAGEPIVRAHLQRGHFKTYMPEAPLFGKYTGRFWWSPQVRGSKELGVALKDYEVRSQ